MRDAPTKFRMEEYVVGMERRSIGILAAMRDAPINQSVEEYVLGMELRGTD